MTSRLKRKLNDLGVDTASNKANENFCLIGTPLPPLEKSKDTGEFVPLWKQEVRDEKGRRRLHGAFTGGWSAGYFNTVGSKEGWTPSTFVSSRGDRAKKQQARPEDFMDEEDLAELQESRNLVDENEEMEFGGTEAEMRQRAGVDAEDDSMAGTLAAALAPSPQDSVGARILRKMGWRIGQGIGPRITWEQRQAQDRAALGQIASSVTEEDEEAKKHLYPRRDTPLLLVPRKDDAHGLGYTPGLGLQASIGAESISKQKGPTISTGFGLGALNEADDDDLDVYDSTMRPQGGRRVAYDITDDDDTMMMGSSKQTRHQSNDRDSRSTGITQTFRDGRQVLKGFRLSGSPVSEDRWFPLPDVPPGWKPNPKRIWEADGNKENQTSSKPPTEPSRTRAEWKASLLSANERGTMLGETPLPSQPRSVFDFMSQKDKERIEKAKENLQTRATGYTPEEPSRTQTAHAPGDIEIPELHPSIAKAALSGFQPFTADPAKQARYTAFLVFASSAASDRRLGLGPLPGQSVEEFNKELADYAKSATVFKPLSGAMASRFQSAAVVENGPKVIEGLHTPDVAAATESTDDDQAKAKEKEDEDPRMAAVRLGMYGPLTREITPWRPERLLCKRFGVKYPAVEDEADGPTPTSSARPSAPETASSSVQVPLAITDGHTPDTAADVTEQRTGPRNLASIGLGEDDDQGRDTLTYQRPGMDVFKAIFASDDEESDDEDEKSAEKPPAAEVEAAAASEDKAPSHLEAADSTPTFYMPSDDAPVQSANESVDLTTFKPTFVPRSERESRKDKDQPKDKKGKDKKKKQSKTLVSFDTEDGTGLHVVPKREKHKDKDGERKKKKRKEKEKREEEDDDSMWVEAPAPEVVQHLDTKMPPPLPPSDTHADQPMPDSGAAAGSHRGRKRAIDFM